MITASTSISSRTERIEQRVRRRMGPRSSTGRFGEEELDEAMENVFALLSPAEEFNLGKAAGAIGTGATQFLTDPTVRQIAPPTVAPVAWGVPTRHRHRRLADPVAAFTEPVGVLATAERRLHHGQRQQVLHDVGRGRVGKLRPAAGLGINASSP